MTVQISISVVQIKRDAYTTTTSEVAPYEIPLLEKIHGDGAVKTINKEVATREISDGGEQGDQFALIEYNRLKERYAPVDGRPVVEEIYGSFATGAFETAFQKAVKKIKKPVTGPVEPVTAE